MSKHIIHIGFWSLLLALLVSGCENPKSRQSATESNFHLNEQLPKALYVTTGINAQNGVLAKGIVIAIQSLNQVGVPVRLETRSVLYDKDKLNRYNMLILSTSLGYHDADRKYSLSFMSDVELENIRSFVERGGVLIAGDNVGRNLMDGTDRISLYQRLTPENYKLSECFGVELTERNMEGYHIEAEIEGKFKGYFREKPPFSNWTLVPDTVFSDRASILGNWVSEGDIIPAIIQNRYGKGTAYLFSSSDFLHPANEGGEWSASQISDFYHFVASDFQERNDQSLQLNPWPGGHKYAFCATFNSAGKLDEYKRVFNYLGKENIDPVLFVNGSVEEDIRGYLAKNRTMIESSGYGYRRYRNMKFPESVNDILKNEDSWGKKFEGFRFPFTMPGYWGLLALAENSYAFESSIGANNLDFCHGSVFPYNLVIANDQFYKTTEILEISPIYHDDYHFLKNGSGEHADPRKLEKNVLLYEKYLQNYWNQAVKPYNGLMVYLGHPAYVGQSDTTLTALKSLVGEVKEDNAWITTINEVVEFRKDLSRLQFYVVQDGKKITIKISGPEGVSLEKVTVNLINKPSSAKAKSGEVSIINKFQVVFDAHAGQEILIW